MTPKGILPMREQLIEFLLENQNKFYRYAFTYVHHREIAMDMVQNSFLKALEQIHTLRNPAAMKTWFYRILTNECLQALKKAKPKERTLTEKKAGPLLIFSGKKSFFNGKFPKN